MVVYFITQTIVYIISSRDDFDAKELKEIASQISKEGGELFMTLAEKLMEKGRKEGEILGIEKGIIQGMQESRKEMAVKLLKRGLRLEDIAEDAELSIEEVKRLRDEMLN